MSPDRPASPNEPSRLFLARLLTNRQKLAIWIISVPLLLVGAHFTRQNLVALAESHKPVAVDSPPISVKTQRLAPERIAHAIRYSGVVKEWQKVDIAFRVGGTILEFKRVGQSFEERDLHEGDRFPRGTVLARLDPADYKLERSLAAEKLAQAEAKFASAKADAENARRENDRIRTAFQRNATAQSDVDSANAKFLSTAASTTMATREIEAARVQLAQADANLAYCTIAMPYAEGTIATRYVEAGERVSAGQKAFQIVDLSSVRIGFGVSDSVVGRLSIGQVVGVTTDALPDERFRGTITKISPTTDSLTRTYLIEVRVTEPGRLRSGMVATVTLNEESTATLLPLIAVTREATTSRLIIYRIVGDAKNKQVQACPVEVNGILDNRVAVRMGGSTGLNAGDEIVVAGVPRLFDGASVTVLSNSPEGQR